MNTNNYNTSFENVISELEHNGTYFPSISQVIYNLGKKAFPKLDAKGKRIRKLDADGKPIKQPKNSTVKLREEDMFEMTEPQDILATVVYFNDGTKVSVTNSQLDGLTFKEHTLSNGKVIKLATNESKEMGLVYAIVKRLVATFTDDGKVYEAPLGRIVKDIIENAFDSQLEAAEVEIAKAKAKAEHTAKLNTAKPKKVYSIRGTLERINDVLDKIASQQAAVEEFVPAETTQPTNSEINIPVNG